MSTTEEPEADTGGTAVAAPRQKRASGGGGGLITGIKARLETPEKGAATLSGTLRDVLIVTWAAPAEKVRPHVPRELPLDVLPNADGDLIAFLQVACFYHENLHWSPVKGGGGPSFHQMTYRVLTRYQGRRGVYDLRSYLSTDEARNGLRVIARQADFARFYVHIAGDPARQTYDRYSIRAVGDRGQTNLEALFAPPAVESAETDGTVEKAETGVVVPPPFTRFEDMVAFLTQREEKYFEAFLPRNATMLAPLHFGPLQPFSGTLKTARASLFTDLDLLTPEELLHPIAVLVQPTLTLTAYPPRLARFESRS